MLFGNLSYLFFFFCNLSYRVEIFEKFSVILVFLLKFDKLKEKRKCDF